MRMCAACNNPAYAHYQWGCETCRQSHDLCRICVDDVWVRIKHAVAANLLWFIILPLTGSDKEPDDD